MDLAILGEYNSNFEPHTYTNHAIEHSLKSLGIKNFTYEWVSTAEFNQNFNQKILKYKSFWIAPGSPYKSMEATLNVIKYARLNNIPLIGTCGGLQHILIEYARNVLNIMDAQHEEYDPFASKLIVNKLVCSLVGQQLDITLIDKSSLAYKIFKKEIIKERYYCNFGLNPEYKDILNINGLSVVGIDTNGEARIFEVKTHRYFIGTLFVPQALSTPSHPHPFVTAFIKEIRS